MRSPSNLIADLITTILPHSRICATLLYERGFDDRCFVLAIITVDQNYFCSEDRLHNESLIIIS